MFFSRCIKKSKSLKKNSNDFKYKEMIAGNTVEFCKSTSLHAVKYVADNNLRPSERYYFGISIMTAIIMVIYLMSNVYSKWASTPIIVGVNPQPTFISTEPFPAVTVCNMNQALKKVAETLSKNSTEYIILRLICRSQVDTHAARTISNWSQVETFISEISQPCEDMLIDCRYGGRRYSCLKLFFPIVTDEGLCCVFNLLHPKYMYVKKYHAQHFHAKKLTNYEYIDWHAETGYPDDLPQLYFPKKVRGAGVSKGLSLTLDVEKDKYFCSSSSSVGFNIALHAPNETPNLKETGVFVEPGKETKLRIVPEKTETDRQLRKIKMDIRHCVFHGESRLKTFAHYTQRNCEKECVAESCLKHCKCITYHMPKIYENISVCSMSELSCMKHINKQLENKSTSCLDECLPGCYEINFQVNSFSTKLTDTGHIPNTNKFGNRSREYIVDNVAVVHLFFKENSFRSNIKTEFIGLSDFLSSIGGLMGLFLGFSFLSITECIFYAIIRPCHSLTQYQKSLNIKKERTKYPSASKRSKKMKKVFKRPNYKKILVNENQEKYHKCLFHHKKKVPYSIAYGFEGPEVEDLHLHGYIE